MLAAKQIPWRLELGCGDVGNLWRGEHGLNRRFSKDLCSELVAEDEEEKEEKEEKEESETEADEDLDEDGPIEDVPVVEEDEWDEDDFDDDFDDDFEEEFDDDDPKDDDDADDEEEDGDFEDKV